MQSFAMDLDAFFRTQQLGLARKDELRSSSIACGVVRMSVSTTEAAATDNLFKKYKPSTAFLFPGQVIYAHFGELFGSD
jgi:hypothetical protein